jgi:hypothetical protein
VDSGDADGELAENEIAPIKWVGGISATQGHERVEQEVGIRVPDHLSIIGMNFKREYSLPSHMEGDEGLPRNRAERLLWIRRKVQDGYYDTERVIRAVADAFLEPGEGRRAGDQS